MAITITLALRNLIFTQFITNRARVAPDQITRFHGNTIGCMQLQGRVWKPGFGLPIALHGCIVWFDHTIIIYEM